MSEPSISLTASAALPSVVPTAGAVAPVTAPTSMNSDKPSLPSPRPTQIPTNEPLQEPVRAKFTSSPGYVVPTPSFTYNVLPKGSPGPRNLQPSPSNPVFRLAPNMPAAALQPPVPGQALGNMPSFSYSVISHANANTAPGQQFPPAAFASHAFPQGGKTAPLPPAVSLQPPVPRQPLQSNQGLSGAISQNFQPQPQLPFPVPRVQVSAAMSFSYGGSNTQPATEEESDKSLPPNQDNSNAAALDNVMALSSLLSSQPAQLVANMSSNSSTDQTTCSSSSSTLVPVNPSRAAAAVSVTTGPKATPSLTELSTPSKAVITESSPSASTASSGATTSSSAPALLHMYSPHKSLPGTVPPLPTHWLHQRAAFVPQQGAIPSTHPSPVHGMASLSTSSVRAQTTSNLTVIPHGGLSLTMHSSPSASSLRTNILQQSTDLARQAEVHKNTETVSTEVAHAWTAHRTETGAVYYYNSITGVSTYERPLEFRGDANLEKAPAQSTPVKWEKLDGTDWTVVITNDGKTYYYDTKNKVSSWQLPPEVAELRKNQESDSKGNTSQVQITSIIPDNRSAPAALSAPAIVTGGRESIVVRPSSASVSSSTLDLVKKKLQDAGTSVTSSPLPVASGSTVETNVSRETEGLGKEQTLDNQDKAKDANGKGNLSDTSSDSDDGEIVPSKEDCIRQFKEMLKERGVAPFSKWDKELPKIVFDPRFKAVPGYAARRAIFEHYVRTRAEEERKEKRAAQKVAICNFKQLLEEASQDIDYRTDYKTFKRKWGSDPRFQALDRKEREQLLNEKVIPLKKAAGEKIQAAIDGFKSMLRERGDITTATRWSKVKDSLRDDPRYKSVKHEDLEGLFVDYLSELKAAEEEAERAVKAVKDEQEKLKERERDMRKRKEREEQEMERIKIKVRRKEAISSYQALLVETIKDPKASWTECKPKLEKDPQNRAKNPDLAQGDAEKLFREHAKELYERCALDYRSLLAEVITPEAASIVTEDGKTILNSWSEAKRLLKSDARYAKMPRKDRESLWLRCTEEITRKQKSSDAKERLDSEGKSRSFDLSRKSPRRSSQSRR